MVPLFGRGLLDITNVFYLKEAFRDISAFLTNLTIRIVQARYRLHLETPLPHKLVNSFDSAPPVPVQSARGVIPSHTLHDCTPSRTQLASAPAGTLLPQLPA